MTKRRKPRGRYFSLREVIGFDRVAWIKQARILRFRLRSRNPLDFAILRCSPREILNAKSVLYLGMKKEFNQRVRLGRSDNAALR